jgi:hypothetical protein
MFGQEAVLNLIMPPKHASASQKAKSNQRGGNPYLLWAKSCFSSGTKLIATPLLSPAVEMGNFEEIIHLS